MVVTDGVRCVCVAGAGIPLNIVLIDTVGRRLTGATNLFFCGLFFCLLQLDVSRGLLTFFMFAARGFSSATFSWVYLYSIEVRLAAYWSTSAL